jgi:hypothetical protein
MMAYVKPVVFALAVVLGVTAASVAAIAQSGTSSRMTTFTSPDGDFQFQYPAFMINCKAQRGNESCGAYMPVCSGLNYDSLICIAYPKNRINELKTFDGAAFVVALEKDAHDEKACHAIPDPPPPDSSHPHTKTINGVEFWVIQTGGAASSHGENQMVYRAFHNNVCYELDINTSGVNPRVYDPPRPKMYNQAPVNKALEQTLQSFKFLK